MATSVSKKRRVSTPAPTLDYSPPYEIFQESDQGSVDSARGDPHHWPCQVLLWWALDDRGRLSIGVVGHVKDDRTAIHDLGMGNVAAFERLPINDNLADIDIFIALVPRLDL